ncbi:MAG: FAD-dependent monooxygenase [Pseudomonadota bacterium]
MAKSGAEAPFETPVDVAIIGGGIVGRALALALADGGALTPVLIDRRPADAPPPGDERAVALSASVVRMLDTLDVWPDVADAAQPVLAMDVTDSELHEPVRPVFLTFDGALEDGTAFAHMVPMGVLSRALDKALAAAGSPVRHGVSVQGFSRSQTEARIETAAHGTLAARLLVAADGSRSPLRSEAGIKTVGWSYDQFGLVTTVAHEEPHDGRAEEHFLPSGPFAILPLVGNRSSLVWTERTPAAKALLRLDRDALEAELAERVPPHYGAVRLDGPMESYPLHLCLARDYIADRFALVGDAAHAIHPLAGQGLNLGFRDVAALAEVLTDAARLGLDPGSLATLEDYQRWRRFDVMQFALVTDVLSRMFGAEFGPMRALRDIGMGLVDRVPRLKDRFMAEAAGLAGTPPRLMRGEIL